MTKTCMVLWKSLGRLFRRLGGKVLIIFLLVATAFGITWLDPQVIRSGPSMEPVERPGAGVIIRTEATHLWFPETLIDLARDESKSSHLQTHAELRIALERRGQQNLWYAFTLRLHQADRGVSEITYIRRPYREPENFREVPEILARAAGDPSWSRTPRFSTAEVHILSSEQTRREPHKLVEKLLSVPVT